MSEPITPALTPEEWAQQGHRMDEIQARQGWFEASVHEPADRHRIAALALHGQPFGFTWEMVDEIRWILSDLDEISRNLLEGVADRIAALLPPRV